MSDFIDLNQLSPDTKYALEQYAIGFGYDSWLKTFMEPHWFAWLIELLKGEPDTEDLFPKGQWATVQRMQELLADAVRAEIRNHVKEKDEQR